MLRHVLCPIYATLTPHSRQGFMRVPPMPRAAVAQELYVLHRAALNT